MVGTVQCAAESTPPTGRIPPMILYVYSLRAASCQRKIRRVCSYLHKFVGALSQSGFRRVIELPPRGRSYSALRLSFDSSWPAIPEPGSGAAPLISSADARSMFAFFIMVEAFGIRRAAPDARFAESAFSTGKDKVRLSLPLPVKSICGPEVRPVISHGAP